MELCSSFAALLPKMMTLFMQPLFLALLPLFFTIVFLFKWLSPSEETKKTRPPSPRKLPIIGNFHQLGLIPHRALKTLAQQHGPLMMLHLGSVPVLVVTSADAAREIMKTHDLIFSNRLKLTIPDKLLYCSKDIAFSHGEYWRQVKSIGVIHLLSNKQVQSFRNVREEETELMMEKIRKATSNSSIFNLTEMFMTLTNDVVCRVALGRKYSDGETGRRFKEMLFQFIELLGVFCVGDYIPWLGWVDRISGLNGRLNRVANGFDELLEGVIKEHMDKAETKREGQDFVDILLQVQRENTTGFPIHRDTIKAVILDMFAAGTHTTFTALDWALAELLRNPKAMKKLQNEVRQIAGGKSKVTENDLERMHYLKLVIKETLRLHSPIPLLVPRESTQDVKLLGYDITAGTQVIINAWAIGRDPLLWEEPEKFLPERFLNTSTDFKGLHFELIPFGAGRRGCPGTLFAITIIELALANLVHNFDIALPYRGRGEDLDMAETSGITFENPMDCVKMTFRSSFMLEMAVKQLTQRWR